MSIIYLAYTSSSMLLTYKNNLINIKKLFHIALQEDFIVNKLLAWKTFPYNLAKLSNLKLHNSAHLSENHLEGYLSFGLSRIDVLPFLYFVAVCPYNLYIPCNVLHRIVIFIYLVQFFFYFVFFFLFASGIFSGTSSPVDAGFCVCFI